MLKRQIVGGSLCSKSDLLGLRGAAALVWCDCEGGENQLFDPTVAEALRSSDIVIEAHDFVAPFTAQRMLLMMSETHDVTVSHSVPDLYRPLVYPQDYLAGVPEGDRISLMAEQRPAPMQWLWCKTREGR